MVTRVTVIYLPKPCLLLGARSLHNRNTKLRKSQKQGFIISGIHKIKIEIISYLSSAVGIDVLIDDRIRRHNHKE